MISTQEDKMSSLIVRVQEKGQVTIPLEIRLKLNLKKGDMVTFVETENGVLIKPAEVVAIEALDAIGKALKAKGYSLKDLVERGRVIREELVQEEYQIPDHQS
jgi:AbrB family looped-hinge helix DNA binding protein